MSWVWIITGAVVLVALLGVFKWIRLFAFAFTIAAVALLLLHFQSDPVEAGAALAAMGGGLLAVRPLRRILMGGFL